MTLRSWINFLLIGVCSLTWFASGVQAAGSEGGIREIIPAKFKQRYESWKAELLSTEFGRQQWDRYANDRNFSLTITVSDNRSMGAGTDKLSWNERGDFVAATITLGSNIEEGYPNPIYYPVLNALSPEFVVRSLDRSIVAATKLSHELGHVNQAAAGDMAIIQLQDKLMPQYNSIFLQNGRNTSDKKLVEIASEMRGTPVEIWESREYWSEVNAMLYLTNRINKETLYCNVLKRIRRNLDLYAGNYEKRFSDRSEFADAPCWK